MKVCLAGALGNFGKEIFKKLIKAWQKVIACNVKKIITLNKIDIKNIIPPTILGGIFYVVYLSTI